MNTPSVTSKFSFPAVANDKTRVLILGSLPGEISLSRSQYYANPRNQFWRLMSTVIGSELVGLPYADRLETLLASGVGLWDVLRSAERAGSLDANIRGHEANSLADFAATLPSLRAFAFNGGKAWNIGRRQLGPDSRYMLVSLPSSSPAHTAPFERKQAEWARLKGTLAAD